MPITSEGLIVSIEGSSSRGSATKATLSVLSLACVNPGTQAITAKIGIIRFLNLKRLIFICSVPVKD